MFFPLIYYSPYMLARNAFFNAHFTGVSKQHVDCKVMPGMHAHV